MSSQLVTLNAYVQRLRVLLQPSTGETVLQLCSSTVTQQCLAAKQRAEALYCDAQAQASLDELDNIKFGLYTQDAKIFRTMQDYRLFKAELGGIAPEEQLKAA